MFIQPVPCDSDAFSHGKGGYNGTNSKSFDMPETNPVRAAVIIRQITSKLILIFGYATEVIWDSSLGKRSVGTIGILQRLEIAIPIQIKM